MKSLYPTSYTHIIFFTLKVALPIPQILSVACDKQCYKFDKKALGSLKRINDPYTYFGFIITTGYWAVSNFTTKIFE